MRVAPTYKAGEDFIEWCERITTEAFETAEAHGQANAIEFLHVNSSRWEIME